MLAPQILGYSIPDSCKGIDQSFFIFFKQGYAEALQFGAKGRNGNHAYPFGP
jgi:hypothetical protein